MDVWAVPQVIGVRVQRVAQCPPTPNRKLRLFTHFTPIAKMSSLESEVMQKTNTTSQRKMETMSELCFAFRHQTGGGGRGGAWGGD